MRTGVLSVGVVAALAAFPAAGQPAVPGAEVAKITRGDVVADDEAFQQSLRAPADPPTLAWFATAAVRIGDLEGAISALERLL